MSLPKIIFSLCFLLLVSQSFFAQTESQRKDIVKDYDLETLDKLSQTFSDNYIKEKRKALAYAIQNNIDVIIQKDDGGVSILEKVLDDGTLIYVTTLNTGSAHTINTDQVHPGGIKGLSLDGEGMNFGIWDGGFARSTHQELTGRIVQMDNPNDLSNHATHVSGTLIASGVNPNVKGMAFKAELTAYDFQNDISEMTNEAMEGMLISNHSYGLTPSSIPESFFGAYLSFTASIDLLTYNAPNYLPVFAVGNSRNVPASQGGPFNPDKNGFDLISGKNLAKNILSVANVLEVSNYIDASSVVMSQKSSWGPTDDGRIKPDISAKGTDSFSSWAGSDESYNFLSGTSMAAPSVCGSLGLLHQHHNNMYGGFLTAASMRALVIHTAREAGDAPGPDYKFGWGLMDTAAAADIISNLNFTSIIEENTLNDGETYTFTVEAINPNEPLVATMAWTDPAGAIQNTSTPDDPTPRLVNDLDLRIIAPDAFTEFKPWALDVSNPELPASKSDNQADNVEKVEIENAVGQYTIEVSHKGILQNSSQDYTIIVSGVAESEFAITTNKSNKSFCANETAMFDFDVNTQSSFTGNINFSQSGLPDSFVTSFSPASLNSSGQTSLSIDNLQSVATGDYPFTVTATSDSESFSVDLNLNIKTIDALNNVILNYPIDPEIWTSLTPVLDWDPISDASSYEVQLSTSPNFGNLLFSTITENTEVEIPELDSGLIIYWRVRALNDCQASPFSSSDFSTMSVECDPLSFSTDTPVNISSSEPNTVQSILNVSSNALVDNIADVNVYFELTHSRLADLVVILTSPDGTVVTLLDQACDDLDDVDVIFDDKGDSQFCDVNLTPALFGTAKSEEKLSTFENELMLGDWILTVQDLFSDNGGSINSFGLEICTEVVLSVNENNLSQFDLYPNPSSGRVEVRLDSNSGQELNVQVFDINGRVLKTFKPNVNSNDFSFDLSELNSGIYLVKLQTQDSSTVKKLILQ